MQILFKPIFVLLFLLWCLPTQAQTDVWKTLMSVKSEQKRDAHIPTFEAPQKALDGKQITITGYMYAYEEAPVHKFFMLSFYPVSMCYFCGGAGPESVIEVTMKKPIKATSRQITLKGTLKLNDTDRDRLFYILLAAEED